jgi:hypothetical protein
MELTEELPGLGNVSVILENALLTRLPVFAGFLNACQDIGDAGG